MYSELKNIYPVVNLLEPISLPARYFLFTPIDKISIQLCYMTIMDINFRETSCFRKIKSYMNHLTTLIFYILQLEVCLVTFYTKLFLDIQVQVFFFHTEIFSTYLLLSRTLPSTFIEDFVKTLVFSSTHFYIRCSVGVI